MDELEKELKTALRRTPPPADFADRVIARVGSSRPPAKTKWRMPALRWAGAIAALVVLLVAGVAAYHGYEQMRGRQARAQVILALRITGSKLHAVRAQIVNAGPQQGDEQ